MVYFTMPMEGVTYLPIIIQTYDLINLLGAFILGIVAGCFIWGMSFK